MEQEPFAGSVFDITPGAPLAGFATPPPVTQQLCEPSMSPGLSMSHPSVIHSSVGNEGAVMPQTLHPPVMPEASKQQTEALTLAYYLHEAQLKQIESLQEALQERSQEINLLRSVVRVKAKELRRERRRLEMQATEQSRTNYLLRRERAKTQALLLAADASGFIPPLSNDNSDGMLADMDPAYTQLCADLAKNTALDIGPFSVRAATRIVLHYFDLPKILHPETLTLTGFGQALVRTSNDGSSEIPMAVLSDFVRQRFAGKCRARSLWNLLRSNHSALVPSDLFPVLESAVCQLPDLADLRGDASKVQRQEYFDVVTARIFMLLGTRRAQHLQWVEFDDSNLAETIFALSECESSEEADVISRLAADKQVQMFHAFRGEKAGLDLHALHRYTHRHTTSRKRCSVAVLSRFLANPLFASAAGEMTLSGFVRFQMMVNDAAATKMSYALWFKCLDLDSDGRLDWHDLAHFFKAKVDELLREGYLAEEQPSFEMMRMDFLSIVPEMGCPGGAKAPQTGLRRAGRTMVDLFCFVDARSKWWRGFT
jgi:hypothetical protein